MDLNAQRNCCLCVEEEKEEEERRLEKGEGNGENGKTGKVKIVLRRGYNECVSSHLVESL